MANNFSYSAEELCIPILECPEAVQTTYGLRNKYNGDLLLLVDGSHEYVRVSSKYISMVSSTHRHSTAQHLFDKFKVLAKSALKSNMANVNNSLTKELYLDDICVRPFYHSKTFGDKTKNPLLPIFSVQS